MNHLLSRKKSIPGGTPCFDILNRDQPPTMVRPTLANTQMTHKQVHIREEPEVSPPKREPKCSFCGKKYTPTRLPRC